MSSIDILSASLREKVGTNSAKKVRIAKNETAKTLSKKILIQEHKLYPRAILKIFNL